MQYLVLENSTLEAVILCCIGWCQIDIGEKKELQQPILNTLC